VAAQPSLAAARGAALLDGSRLATGDPEAGDAPTPDRRELLRSRLRELSRSETPVWIRWKDASTRERRTLLAKVSSVSDRESQRDGRWVKQWLLIPDTFRGDIDLDSVESVVPAGISPAEYDAAIQPEGPRPLGQELARAGLSPEQVESMRSHSRGFMTAYDFLKAASFGGRGTTIGVTDNLDQYTALTRAAGMTHWKIPYRKWFGGIHSPRPAQFMDRLTAADGPIYMFLPPMILDEEAYPNTLAELQWLLAHPGRMKDVRFVFGGYELFSRDNQDKLFSLGLRHGKGKRRALIVDSLRRIMAGYPARIP